jgi:hypothetical protein
MLPRLILHYRPSADVEPAPDPPADDDVPSAPLVDWQGATVGNYRLVEVWSEPDNDVRLDIIVTIDGIDYYGQDAHGQLNATRDDG